MKGIAEFERQHPDEAPRLVADRWVATLTAAERDEALAMYAARELADRRRQRVREVEQAAAEQPPQLDWAAEYRRQRERQSELIKSRPEREAMWRANPQDAPKQSRIYQEWASSAEGREWFAARAAEEANRPTWGEQMQRILDVFRAEVRLELTEELLSASFSTGNGGQVTWGAASVADHEARRDYLLTHASGAVATAQLHEAAIQMLTKEKARCLSDLAHHASSVSKI